MERPPPTIRPLQWRDFEDLAEGYLRAYDERDRGEPIWIHLFGERPSMAFETTWFASLYRKVLEDDAVALVGEVDGRAVGMCAVTRSGARKDSEVGHVGVLGISVHEGHRGHGIGEALMRATLEACRGRFEVIQLTVFSVNERAHQLYRRLGFEDTGTLRKGAKRGSTYYDVDYMGLDLTSWTAPPERTVDA